MASLKLGMTAWCRKKYTAGLAILGEIVLRACHTSTAGNGHATAGSIDIIIIIILIGLLIMRGVQCRLGDLGRDRAEGLPHGTAGNGHATAGSRFL
jgi:hypothetical protein